MAPTSVVTNWQYEAGRFAPDLAVYLHHGPDRDTARIAGADLVVTSYALLQRDVDALAEHHFHAVALDEAWRRGDGEPLAARLRGNPERIAALLEGAAAYCQARGLEYVADTWTAWGAPDQTLQLAHDPQWQERLAGRYRVPATRTQLDLFEDAGATVLERDAAAALSRGAPDAAERAVAALAQRCPDHPRLGAYQRLATGLHRPARIDDPPAYLDAVLEELEPAATEVLGAGARDFLTPHWRALTDALAAQPFDTGWPRRTSPLGACSSAAGGYRRPGRRRWPTPKPWRRPGRPTPSWPHARTPARTREQRGGACRPDDRSYSSTTSPTGRRRGARDVLSFPGAR